MIKTYDNGMGLEYFKCDTCDYETCSRATTYKHEVQHGHRESDQPNFSKKQEEIDREILKDMEQFVQESKDNRKYNN